MSKPSQEHCRAAAACLHQFYCYIHTTTTKIPRQQGDITADTLHLSLTGFIESRFILASHSIANKQKHVPVVRSKQMELLLLELRQSVAVTCVYMMEAVAAQV